MSRTVALVVNPTAGKGRAARCVEPVAERLRKGGIDVRQVAGRTAEESLDLAHAAVADGVDAVVALGGDGMAHLALQAVAGTATPLGLIPAGTGNDLAGTLGLPDDPLAAADVVVGWTVRDVDAVRADDRWWACVLGAGFDSAVNERANTMSWPRGKRRYDIAILAELRVFRPLPFVIHLDGVRWETEAMLVAVANARSYGAGMQIAPSAEIDDGLLDITVLGPVGKFEFVRMYPTVYKGTHVRHPAVTTRRAREVTLEAPGVIAYADGERFAPLPLTNTCMPGALRVLAPSLLTAAAGT